VADSEDEEFVYIDKLIRADADAIELVLETAVE
jgi:hypothetical protein